MVQKEKFDNKNNEEKLDKLKGELVEAENKLGTKAKLIVPGGTVLSKNQKIGEYTVKQIQTSKNGRIVLKLEDQDGVNQYELKRQEPIKGTREIETIWESDTQQIRISFPNTNPAPVQEEAKMPEIIMEHAKSQPRKTKETKEDIAAKMPHLEMADKEIIAPAVGSKIFLTVDGKSKEYTIAKGSTSEEDGKDFVLQMKNNPKNRKEEPVEMTPEEFTEKFNAGKILLSMTPEREEKITNFQKEIARKKEEGKVKRSEEKNKATLDSMAADFEKTRGELDKKDAEAKKVAADKKTKARSKTTKDDSTEKSTDDGSVESPDEEKIPVTTTKIEPIPATPEPVTLKERLSKAKINIEEKLKGKSKNERISENTRDFLKEEFKKKIKTEAAETVKDKARKDYIEAKSKKPSFWKLGFGKEKYKKELKEKEEDYLKAKKAYLETSGEDALDFVLDEREKVQKDSLEKRGLGERIKDKVTKGIKWWEQIGTKEEDSKTTRFFKKTAKTLASIAIIGGSSALTVLGLAGVGIGTATALAGGVASYVGRRALTAVAFSSAINLLPERYRGVAQGIIMGASMGVGLFSTDSIATLAGVAGLGASHLARLAMKGKTDEALKATIKEKIEKLKNKTVEGENIEDKIKRLEIERDEIYKYDTKQRRNRRMIQGLSGLAIGTITIEMSGFAKDYRDHHQEHKYVPRDHDPIPKPQPQPPIEQHTINPYAIIHKGDGIENAFIRQIEHDPRLQEQFHWDGKENLHHFAQREAHLLAIKEGYVDSNGNEIRVAVADKVGYEIKIENGHATVLEKDLQGNLTDTAHHEGDAFEKDTEKYEYKHAHTSMDAANRTNIDPMKTLPADQVLEEIPNNTQELHTDPVVLHTEPVPEVPLNVVHLDEQHPAAQPQENHATQAKPEPFRASRDIDYRVPRQDQMYQRPAGNMIYQNQQPGGYVHDNSHEIYEQQVLAQVSNIHNQNVHHIFHNMRDWDNVADDPAKNYMKMEESPAHTKQENELIHHLHKLRTVTGLDPKHGNIFRNPENVDHYMDRAYEKAVKMGKLDQVLITY